jgi:hypothetical protein
MPHAATGAPTYDGRRFRSVSNDAAGTPGDVGDDTLFEYRQSGAVVWAEYRGGAVARGALVATADAAGVLDARYAHVSSDGALRTGVCRSVPETLPDGRLRLHETWRWTGGAEGEGTSTVEEVPATRP